MLKVNLFHVSVFSLVLIPKSYFRENLNPYFMADLCDN